jgi:hypothetical protein
LDVRASLVREEGEVVIYASCVLGEKRLCAEATIKSGTRRPTPYDQSCPGVDEPRAACPG